MTLLAYLAEVGVGVLAWVVAFLLVQWAAWLCGWEIVLEMRRRPRVTFRTSRRRQR